MGMRMSVPGYIFNLMVRENDRLSWHWKHYIPVFQSEYFMKIYVQINISIS